MATCEGNRQCNITTFPEELLELQKQPHTPTVTKLEYMQVQGYFVLTSFGTTDVVERGFADKTFILQCKILDDAITMPVLEPWDAYRASLLL